MNANERELGRLLGVLGILVIGFLCLVGCSKNHISASEASKTSSEVEKWVTEGWVYLETFGTRSEEANYVSHVYSAAASTVTAYASDEGGHQISKKFSQDVNYYLIVNMQSGGGSFFSLIFTKPK